MFCGQAMIVLNIKKLSGHFMIMKFTSQTIKMMPTFEPKYAKGPLVFVVVAFGSSNCNKNVYLLYFPGC